jgi:sporulation protein YlmC with PRC-barrel domain
MEFQMNYEERDTYGMYKGGFTDSTVTENGHHGPGPRLMGADTLNGNDVFNEKDEDLGDIKEFMLDMGTGRVSYAVLSFGGFLGMGDKLFAVPWNALKLDTVNKRFVLNVDKARLESAPGFDKDHWPNMSDQTWAKGIHSYYGTKPYVNDLPM